jgi:signal transduction histidine kinase
VLRNHALRLSLRLPRRTVRLRLTLVYAVLFIASGAGLLAVTYVLVRHASSGVYVARNANGSTFMINTKQAGPPPRPGLLSGVGGVPSPKQVGAAMRDLALTKKQVGQLRAQVRRDLALAKRQHDAELHQLLEQSGIALAIMAALSIGLGWLAAGRVLRPLRTLNDHARAISASSLDRRLALTGPDDELKQLADTFDDLLARLDASFAAQRQFVANASHELRTPLARAQTLAEVAIGDPDATVESLRASHLRVLAAGKQQERLIEALLTLARSERGLDEREPFDLAEVARRVVTSRRPDAEERRVYVHATLQPARTTGAPHLAERLVANLVDNALRHNLAAGGRVDVFTAARDGCAWLWVANSGPPVPPEEVERLLQPFQRLGAERTDHSHGLGLGLSIVQAIATAHDATLSVLARDGGGLDAEVVFPAAEAVQTTARPGRTSFSGRRRRVVSTGGLTGSESGGAPKEASTRSGGGVP